jgi:Methyltransferase domain
MAVVIDKTGALARLKGAKLDLGCGQHKRSTEHLGADALDYEGVDLVGDVFDVLAQIPDETVAEVFSSHFVEHIEDLDLLIDELARVIRPHGLLETIPHFSNPYFWSDPTHRRSFGLYSMAYFAQDTSFKRTVTTYRRALEFRLDRVNLVFKSPRPLYFRYAVRRLLGSLVNLSTGTQEFYEENLCYLFPCCEVQYLMSRLANTRPLDNGDAPLEQRQ